MPWSAEIAMLDMWREMDKDVMNGEMRRFFKRHLQMAYDAGAQEAYQDRDGPPRDEEWRAWLDKHIPDWDAREGHDNDPPPDKR
jgi:hypothetical protein